MPIMIAMVSQKGGVGKSTLAQLLAVYIAEETGSSVRIVDLDGQQQTSIRWANDRKASGIQPDISVVAANPNGDLLRAAGDCDVAIFDAPGRADQLTDRLARMCNLVIQPTSTSLRDLQPAIEVFHELAQRGVDRGRLLLAMVKVKSDSKEEEIRDTLKANNFAVLKYSLADLTSYENAMDVGHSVAHTPHRGLNKEAKALAQAMLEAALEQTKEQQKRAANDAKAARSKAG